MTGWVHHAGRRRLFVSTNLLPSAQRPGYTTDGHNTPNGTTVTHKRLCIFTAKQWRLQIGAIDFALGHLGLGHCEKDT